MYAGNMELKLPRPFDVSDHTTVGTYGCRTRNPYISVDFAIRLGTKLLSSADPGAGSERANAASCFLFELRSVQ